MKLRSFILFVFMAFSVFWSGVLRAGPSLRQASESPVTERTIGALIPLNGTLGALGQDAEAGIKIGVNEFNRQLQEAGEKWQISLDLRDTETNSTMALTQLEALKQSDTHLIIGPVTSASVETTKELAQNNETLLLSPSSVATDHSMPGDGVFRLVPDADSQGEFYVGQLLAEGIDTIIIVYRNDTWGRDFSEAIAEGFKEKGGSVDGMVSYDINNIDADQIALDIKSQLDMVSTGQEEVDSVAIVILSFGEVSDILHSAKLQPSDDLTFSLGSVRWFGAASTYPEIIDNEFAREFAEMVQYTTVILAIDRSLPIYDKVRSAIKSMRDITREPDVHSYIAYDSVQILGETIRIVNSTDAPEIINQLPAVAENYNGFVGNARLNENGDLMSGNYQRWQVMDGRWQRVMPADSSDAMAFVSSMMTFILPAGLVRILF